MSKVQQHIQAAKTFIYGEAETSSMAQSKVIFDRVRADLKSVNEDPMLSGVGKAAKGREIQEQGAKDLANMVAGFRKSVDAQLDLAEKEARAIIAKPANKPEQHVLDAFADTYQDALTRLTVFGTRDAATTLLRQMETVSDPHIAKTLVSEFSKFGPAMAPHVDRLRLETVYNRVRDVAETDEKAVAKSSLQEIERLRTASPVSTLINIGVGTLLGDSHKSVISNYQQYLD